MKAKIQIFNKLATLDKKKKDGTATVEDYRDFQVLTYKGLDIGALDEKEGEEFLNKLLAPQVDKIKQSLENLGSNRPFFGESFGFGKLEEYFDDNISLAPFLGDLGLGEDSELKEDANKLILYEAYYDMLEALASERDMTVGELAGLPKTERAPLFDSAYNHAILKFAKETDVGTFDDPRDAVDAIKARKIKASNDFIQDTIDGKYDGNKALNKEEAKLFEDLGL
jgi:hypothetical protein